MAKKQRKPGSKVSKSSKPSKKKSEQPKENPEIITVDVTKETYIATKMEYLAQVPKLARPFVNQYFEFLKHLNPEQVMDWMEGNQRLKELYKVGYERFALATARGLIKAFKSIRKGAEQAINWQVAAYTIRFENPETWEVIEAFGEEGIEKLKQGIEDIKEILSLKEEAA